MKDMIKQARVGGVPFANSRVDIIIPYHNQEHKVSRLINSIIFATKSNPYQITLVDDASHTDSFAEGLKDFDKNRPDGTLPILQVVRNKTQLGFGASLEVGFNITQHPWVIFMHSDCEIRSPNWMIEMGRSLLNHRSENVRMVCARTNFSNSGDERVVSDMEDMGEDMILKDTFLPLHCVMCHRDLFSKIGGFIKKYPLTGYEDQELGTRMQKYGFKQAICGKSWVWHEGSGTILPLLKRSPDIQSVLDANRLKCIADLQKLY